MTVGRSVRQIGIVIRKELKDSLRDRRALWSIVFSVSIGPVIIGFMMNRVADRQRESEQVRVPVVGMQHAPALVDWLRQQSGVNIVEGPKNPEEAVRNQEEELAIIIPKDFAQTFNQSKPAVLQIVADSSRNDARPTVERVRRLLQHYSAEIGSLRLIARGVSPAASQPILLEDIEVSTAQQRAAQILTFIPMFIIMAGFIGGMQIATDATAGERERGSLEPLLVNPAPRLVFVGGKWLAAALAAIACTRADHRAVRKPAAIPAARGNGDPVPHRTRAHHRHHRRSAADVPVLVGAAVGSGHARAIVQGSAKLHGRAGADANDSWRARRALSDGQRAVDVRDADARALRAAHERARRTDAGDQRLPHLGWRLHRRGGYPCAHHRHAV